MVLTVSTCSTIKRGKPSPQHFIKEALPSYFLLLSIIRELVAMFFKHTYKFHVLAVSRSRCYPDHASEH